MDFYHIANWFQTNRKAVTIGAVAVCVVGAIIAIVLWHNDKTEADANAELMALPSAFAANPTYQRPSPGALDQIAKQYPGTPAGDHAEILAASVLFTDGKYADAEQAFKKFLADHNNSPLAAQADIGIAASLEAEGKTSDAIAKYQDVIGHYPSDAYIINPAKLTLARLLEDQNKPDQALKYYDELAKNPSQYDPWAGEARERREILLAKHPELNKPAVSMTSPAPGQSSQPQIIQIPNKSAAPAATKTPAPAPAPAKK